MKRIFSSRGITLWLMMMLPVLSGCASKNGQQSPLLATLSGTRTAPETNDKLMASIQKLREESREIDLSEDMFRRKMSLNYAPSAKTLTEHQKKVIGLFFQTLPESKSISIIISIAPTSKGEGFEALHSAWMRIQDLKHHLKTYSPKIEELYLPDQSNDTVTIQVLGGKGV